VPLVAITCFEERQEEEAAGAKTASRSLYVGRGTSIKEIFLYNAEYLDSV
jgi:hypothetical protein